MVGIGEIVGTEDGLSVGVVDGLEVGGAVGDSVGKSEGAKVGIKEMDGCDVGASDGCWVIFIASFSIGSGNLGSSIPPKSVRKSDQCRWEWHFSIQLNSKVRMTQIWEEVNIAAVVIILDPFSVDEGLVIQRYGCLAQIIRMMLDI